MKFWQRIDDGYTEVMEVPGGMVIKHENTGGHSSMVFVPLNNDVATMDWIKEATRYDKSN